MASTGLGFSTCSTLGTTSSGTLSQLIALGASDTNLTACPTITYWRLRIQKCTNFAMESILQTFTGTAQWGSSVQITLNRTGDLVYWMYVLIDIPAIAALQCPSGATMGGCVQRSPFPYANVCNPCEDPKEDNPCDVYGDPLGDDDSDDEWDDDLDDCSGLRKPYANWVNSVGFAAIARAAFSIGGQVIDCVYSHYMHMWEELSGQPGKRLEEMIGKRFTRAQLVADSQRPRRLYVPLPFYFTQNSGNALPLVSLQFHSLQVHVSFAPLQSLIQVSDCDVQVVKCGNNLPLTNNDMNAVLDTTYVYLDMEERDRFAVGSFQQLITQVQQFSTTANSGTITAQLNFNHPTLELIWAVQRQCQADANNTFDYSGAWGRDPIERAALSINNQPRFDREATYFRLVQPYQFHTNIPKGFIYVYSFALHPESCQPSGSLNFSRIDNSTFFVKIQPAIAQTNTILIMFARSWNVVRYREGLGGVLYANIDFATGVGCGVEWV